MNHLRSYASTSIMRAYYVLLRKTSSLMTVGKISSKKDRAMKRNLILCAMAAVVLSACAKEIVSENTIDTNLETVTFKASASVESKTILMDERNVYWTAEDQIGVKGAPEPFTNNLTGNEISSRVDFTGAVEPADVYYAVYPFSSAWDGTIVKSISQTIQQAETGSFGSYYNVTVAKTTNQDLDFGFKNVLGHVKFTNNNTEPGYLRNVIISSIGGESLSGDILIDCAADDPEAVVADGRSYVSTVFLGDHADGDYYVAMIPGEYSQGLVFDFVRKDGMVATVRAEKPLTLKAGNINPIGSLDYLEWTDPSEGSEYSIWTGKTVLKGSNSACDCLAAWYVEWSEMLPGDVLVFHIEQADADISDWYMELKTCAEWGLPAGIPEKYEGETEVVLELTEEMIADIEARNGLWITGQECFLTNVELIPVPREEEEPIEPGEGETVIWEGNWASGTWGGNADLSWGAYDWSQHKPGDVLKIYGGPTDPEAENWVLSLRVGDGWDFLAGVPQYLNKVYDYTVTLTQEMIDDLVARGGLVVQGDNYTMRMITVKEGEVSEDGEISVVLWEGSTSLGTDWSTAVQIQGPAKIPYGAKLHVEYETPEGVGDGYYQIKFCYIGADWGWVQMESHLPYANDYGCVTLVAGSSHYALPLIDADVDAINNGKGLVVQGYAATITKVYYTIGGESEDGETVLWEGELLVDGWENQPYALSDAGMELKQAGAKAGQFVNFYVEPLSDYWKLQITEGHWGPIYMYVCAAGSDTENGTYIEWDLAANGGKIQLELTQEIIDAAFTQKWWGGTFVLNGDDLKVTKITLQ